MGDGPVGAKEAKRVQFGDFHERNNLAGCSRSSRATRMTAPAAEIFKEVSKYFGICHNHSNFLSGRQQPPYLFFFCFSLLFYATFYTRHQTLRLHCWDLLICKGRRISTLLRRILNTISFILLIQHVFFICYLCVLGCYG